MNYFTRYHNSPASNKMTHLTLILLYIFHKTLSSTSSCNIHMILEPLLSWSCNKPAQRGHGGSRRSSNLVLCSKQFAWKTWPHTKTATTESSLEEIEFPKKLIFWLRSFSQIPQTISALFDDISSIPKQLDGILSGLENNFSLYSEKKKLTVDNKSLNNQFSKVLIPN